MYSALPGSILKCGGEAGKIQVTRVTHRIEIIFSRMNERYSLASMSKPLESHLHRREGSFN
jgi:hypothetical protein